MGRSIFIRAALVGAAVFASAPEALADAAAGDLPTVSVAPLAIHTIPSDKPSEVRPVTIVPLKGAPAPKVRHRDANVAPPKRYAVVKGPYARGERTAAPPVPLQPVFTGPERLFGRAEVEDGVSLGIDGHMVPLFGIGIAPGDHGAAARAALRLRLAASTVVCDAQPGDGVTTAYICRDATGADLGERLVAQGLAVADRNSSFQYVPIEDAARDKHLGIWGGR